MRDNTAIRKELMHLSGDAMEQGNFEASHKFMQAWKEVEKLMTSEELLNESELNADSFLSGSTMQPLAVPSINIYQQ
tara:strand:+ start:279 stop:509 length:231 start_codon:yes stop_codon:yes gene_type:complete